MREKCSNVLPSYRQELEGTPGWEYVDFRGHLDRESVWQLLSESRVGLCLLRPLVNYLDALPVKLFEYMASGVPVICSDFPGWKKIVEGAGCGICVDISDADQIEKAARNLLDNPGMAEEMGSRGREAVTNKYSWRSQELKLLAFYSELQPSKDVAN